jgi:undecaprenyl diphosphate synthase
MEKVYVLEYLRDLAAEKPSAEVLGVFKSEEEAQEVMKQGFREIYDELNVTEEDIARVVYTRESGDPDMIVRTGGDLRISNFLLWQSAYAELYFTDTLWPDLTPEDVDEAIRVFYSRKRRYGGL